MKVLVIGSGGREHALCTALKSSPQVSSLYCLPGSDAISTLAECIPIEQDNIEAIGQFAQTQAIDLTIVGPELPLSLGIADIFRAKNLKIFGPDKKAAQLESSKIFAKEFMQRHNIPSAGYKKFTSLGEAVRFVQKVQIYPLVLKLNGLAGGKGVFVCQDQKEVLSQLTHIYHKTPEELVVIEEFITGYEISVLAICDGKKAIPLVTAQDHKTLYDGNKGPNTGGMGAYAPVPFVTDSLFNTIQQTIIQPTIEGLIQDEIDYRGVLYFGLMIDQQDQPYVLEYNARFGDPETQAILPLLNEDLADICYKAAIGDLSSYEQFQFYNAYSVCVVLASGGYPGTYEKGYEIQGLDSLQGDLEIFHSGTCLKNGAYYTNGGRVLSVVVFSRSLEDSVDSVYKICSQLNFHRMHYRQDIAYQACGVSSLNKG